MASKLWEQVNEIIGRKKSQKLVSVGGQLSLDQINNFFRTVAISSNHQPAGDFVPDCDQHAVKFKFCTFSVSSVLTQLQTLNIKKATGPDGISGCFLRSVAEELAEPLTFIFNMSIQSGSIPRAWKQSNVSPIHKGGSCDDPGNFRPISVVPIIAKVLEKLVANQLLNYFETHRLLHDHQGAYRCGRSSNQILLYSIDMIVSALDKGLAVCAAFLDLRKAFDSLDHLILLKRLHHLGICDMELQWFRNYLNDRLQRVVKYDNSYSEWGSVLGGIPQGSALGPLLFLVYVNSMPLQVKNGVLVQFANDL